MYPILTVLHSLFRWLVLASLIYAIARAYLGFSNKAVFTSWDNAVRHWTATLAHIQLVIGIVLYSQSPLIKNFWSNFKEGVNNSNSAFFGLIHITLMLSAIVILTIGSALVKRKDSDDDKFKTMLIWFTISMIIIFIAIPWPFSPLANRPYFR